MLTATLLAAFAHAKEETFADVQQSIQQRTGKMVRWELDQAAHEQTLRDVRLLLRKPLTVERAVQIALFNNRSLQATFEEIGLSALGPSRSCDDPESEDRLGYKIPRPAALRDLHRL